MNEPLQTKDKSTNLTESDSTLVNVSKFGKMAVAAATSMKRQSINWQSSKSDLSKSFKKSDNFESESVILE